MTVSKHDTSNLSESYKGPDADQPREEPKGWFPIPLGRTRYLPIQDSEDPTNNGTDLALELRRKTAAIWRWRCLSAGLALLLVIMWMVSPPKPPQRYPQPGEETNGTINWMRKAEVFEGHYWCGPSTAEAKKRGCDFNVLHNRWMSPSCKADFEPARRAVMEALDGDIPEFRFYRDKDGKPGDAIPDEELGELELLTPTWTTVGHHMTHCMYLLLQAAAALNLGTKTDMVVHAWGHAKHCASVILNETKRVPEWNDVASFGHTRSGVCW